MVTQVPGEERKTSAGSRAEKKQHLGKGRDTAKEAAYGNAAEEGQRRKQVACCAEKKAANERPEDRGQAPGGAKRRESPGSFRGLDNPKIHVCTHIHTSLYQAMFKTRLVILPVSNVKILFHKWFLNSTALHDTDLSENPASLICWLCDLGQVQLTSVNKYLPLNTIVRLRTGTAWKAFSPVPSTRLFPRRPMFSF